MKKQLEKEEKKVIEVMQKNQSLINRRFMENKEKEIILQSALEIEQPDHFLQVTTHLFLKGYVVFKNSCHNNLFIRTHGSNIIVRTNFK